MNPRLKVVASLFAATILLAACGSSGGTSTSAPTSAAASAAASEPASAAASEPASAAASASEATSAMDDMAAKGQAAAQANGGPVELPEATIGYIRYAAVSEGDTRLFNSVVAAADALNWKVVPCDSGGVPAKMDECGQSLLNQNVNLLVTDGIPPSLLAQTRELAKSKDVSIISHGGSLAPEERVLYAGSYEIDDAGLGNLLADYLGTQLVQNDEVSLWGYPAYFGEQRDNNLRDAVSANGWKLVDDAAPNSADLVGSSKTAYQAKLIQFPDLKAIWCTFDATSYGVAQAVNAKYPGKTFPDRPMVVTFLGNPSTLDQIRSGAIDASAEENLEWSGWVVVDQAAELLARGTTPSPDARPTYQGMTLVEDTVVTKDNVPAKGELLPSTVDYQAFFKAKWADEFGAK